jgi:hypothetical protein
MSIQGWLMAKFIIHGGDFIKGALGGPSFRFGSFQLCTEKHCLAGESISGKEIESIEVLTEANAKRLGGSLGWGAVGALALGPLGGLAGLIVGGRGTDVTILCQFKDGRKLVATVDSKTYAKIRASMI